MHIHQGFRSPADSILLRLILTRRGKRKTQGSPRMRRMAARRLGRTLFCFLGLATAGLLAAAPARGQGAVAAPPPIQDNSFLVEEAYNQDPGVVQTIQTYARVAGTGDWAY